MSAGHSQVVRKDTVPINQVVQNVAALDGVFADLRESWLADTALSSSGTQITQHPSYRKIIVLGKPVVPLILKQLVREGNEPHFWFTALREITGQDVIAESSVGRARAMANDWIKWGHKTYGAF
jgi:hypothetical protein